MNNITPNNICFIIITYNPQKDFEDNIKPLLKYNKQVYIFDNNSNKKNVLKNLKNIEVFFCNKNQGYASGINYFIKKKINDHEWFCMLDQDSILDLKYLEYINKFVDFTKSNIGLIGTNVKYKNMNKKLINFKTSKKVIRQKTLICSGTLINRSIIKKFGYLKDDFFMEYIDVEYCLRIEKQKYSNYITNTAFLNQSFGNNEKYYFLGKQISIDNHEPIRYFYRSRNFKYCIKKYFTYETKEILIHMFNFFKMYTKIVFFENYKLKKTYFIIKGLLTKL